MRFGLVRQKFDLSGGAERTLLLLARGLLARGHRVDAVVAHWEGDPPQGLTVHGTPLPKGPKPLRLLGWARKAALAMEELNPDVWLSLERVPGCPLFRAGDGCHAAWLNHRSAYEGAARRLSFRLNPLHRVQLRLERETLRNPALQKVLCGSRLVAEELIRYHGLARETLSVVYNGVDEESLAPVREAATRDKARGEMGLTGPTALFLGSGFERKGLAFALEALAALPEVELLVVGKDRPAPWQRRAAALGVGERVRFMGTRRDVAALLAAADALILPTIYDPCSNACLEALWAGLPVVTTRRNGAVELMEGDASGRVVDDPSRREELAGALALALDTGRRPSSLVPTQAAWLDATLEILEDAAGGKGSPRQGDKA